MKTLTLTIATLLACAAPAVAQERLESAYKTELSVMYSTLRDAGELAPLGIVIDFGRQVARIGGLQTSIIGEIAFNRFGEHSWDETYSHASAAVRFGKLTGGRARVFGQVLFGVQKSFDLNNVNVAPGVGLNFALTRSLDLKTQVDFPIVNYVGDIYKQVRFSVGIGVPFGAMAIAPRPGTR